MTVKMIHAQVQQHADRGMQGVAPHQLKGTDLKDHDRVSPHQRKDLREGNADIATGDG